MLGRVFGLDHGLDYGPEYGSSAQQVCGLQPGAEEIELAAIISKAELQLSSQPLWILQGFKVEFEP